MKIYDYLIIGSGLAGLNAALTAAKKGTVLIITKKKAVESSTNWAQGGIAGVLSHNDSISKHVQDTLLAGSFHNKKSAVTYLAKHSQKAIEKLQGLGVPFAQNKDKSLQLTREGGHQERRIAFVGDYTGKSIQETLVAQVKQNSNIELIENCPAIKLLAAKGKCYGAQVIFNQTVKNIFAYHTVLATGGLGQIYLHTTNPTISTGDGLALGHSAGCATKDLEYIQFHPTAFDQKEHTKFLLSEALRGEGAILKNYQDEAFMKKYSSLKELAPRDIVARSIYQEQKKGQVYLDLRHLHAQEVRTRFPQIYQKLKTHGYDLTKNLIPITPAAHYLCGGLKVELNGQSNVKNLFVYGELACTGVHGANRLASNSLLEAMVFSENISKAKEGKTFKIKPKFALSKLAPQGAQGTELKKIRQQCQKIMWEKVGIVRQSSELRTAAKALEQLLQDIQQIEQSQGSNAKISETKSMLLSALLVTQAAKKNTKSLGCHYFM